MADQFCSNGVLGIPGDLASFHDNVIATIDFSWHAHAIEDIHNRLGKFLEVMQKTLCHWH